MQKMTRLVFSLVMALSVAMGAFALTGCASGDQGSTDQTEQDDCYGDDLPVEND